MLLIEYVIFVKYFDSAPKDDGTTTRNGSVSEDFAIPKVCAFWGVDGTSIKWVENGFHS